MTMNDEQFHRYLQVAPQDPAPWAGEGPSTGPMEALTAAKLVELDEFKVPLLSRREVREMRRLRTRRLILMFMACLAIAIALVAGSQ